MVRFVEIGGHLLLEEEKEMPEQAIIYEFNGLKEHAYSLTQQAIASTLDGADYSAGKVSTLFTSLPFSCHHDQSIAVGQ